MKDIFHVLKTLDFTESEIKTYLTALESGSDTVLNLTERTGLARQTIYHAIETLVARGLMTSVEREKKTIYAAEHPRQLLAYARRREEEMAMRVRDLEEALPELELRAGGEKPIVKLFEGKEGIKAILEDMIGSGEQDFEEVTDVTAMESTFPREENRELMERLSKISPYFRGLYAGKIHNPIQTISRHELPLPEKFCGFRSSMTLYGDKAAFVTFEGNLPSILIESASITQLLRTLFTLASQAVRSPNIKDELSPLLSKGESS